MLIFYYSPLCPRCARARKHLRALLGDRFERDCHCIDIVKQARQTWRDGIRMIPALRYGDATISGIVLLRDEIEMFLKEHGLLTAPEDGDYLRA